MVGMKKSQSEIYARYQDRGIGGRTGFGKNPAVVLVDMLASFYDESRNLGADMEESLEAASTLVTAARGKNVPIVYVWSAWDQGARNSGRWVEKIPSLTELTLGSPGIEIHPKIAPEDGDTMVLKKGPSAFFNTPLYEALTNIQIDTVLLCGASTSGCIRATAIDSLSHGFRTVVPAEAVGDRAAQPHLANLFDIDAKYADVVPLEAVLTHFGELRPDFARRRAEAEEPRMVGRGTAEVWPEAQVREGQHSTLAL